MLQTILRPLALTLVSVLFVGSAHATSGFASFREMSDYYTAVQLSNRFLDCVDRAANADDDPDAVADAVSCFGSVLADDFTITIDGVAGSRPFPDPASFVAFATGPANAIRTNVSILPGVYSARGFEGRGRRRRVSVRSNIDIVQTVVAPNPVFGTVLGGQDVRGVISFTAAQVKGGEWRITSSRFTVLDIQSGLDIQSLPRLQ